MPSSDELHLYAWLLGQPQADAGAALAEQADTWPWLAAPAAELAAIPLAEWQAEHTRLFVTGYPKTPCPPFASVYLEGCMHGQVCADLAERYAAMGLMASGAATDYLGTILAAWAHLVSTMEDPQVGRQFAMTYLDPWARRFCTDLQGHAGYLLYRHLAERLASHFPVATVP